MEKLISKNPIQRFKQGKQIPELWFFNGKRVYSDDGGKSFKINEHWRVAPGQNKNLVKADKLSADKKAYRANGKWFYVGSGKQVSNFKHKSQNQEKVVSSKKETTSGPETSVVPPKTPRTSTRQTPVTRQVPSVPVFMDTSVQRNWKGSVGDISGVTQEQRDILKSSGYFTDDSFKDARSLQGALNNYFNSVGGAEKYNTDNSLSRIAEDNKWGDQSQKALTTALSRINYTIPNTPAQTVATRVLATPTEKVIPQIPISSNYNRSQVRQKMRDMGLNPYAYSGAQRQALRYYLNGRTDFNKDLLQGIIPSEKLYPERYTSTYDKYDFSNINSNPAENSTLKLFKKGGLIPQSPVQQFKLGGGI